jgi:hypothetical protein
MPNASDVNPASQASERAYEPAPVVRAEHAEDQVTRLIEQQTAKLPSDLFLFAAIGSMGVSLFLQLTGRREASRFVGMWPPALLTMGLYNKLVKIARPQ